MVGDPVIQAGSLLFDDVLHFVIAGEFAGKRSEGILQWFHMIVGRLAGTVIDLPFPPNIGEPRDKFSPYPLTEFFEFMALKNRPDVVIIYRIKIFAAESIASYGLHE